MWKGSYGKEPFDLRLTVLRFMGNFVNIIVLTMIGTLFFGGGYYVKNVLLGGERQYGATSTYKVDYVTPPVNSGDYFINEATWNTLVQTTEFMDAVEKLRRKCLRWAERKLLLQFPQSFLRIGIFPLLRWLPMTP